MQLQLCTWPEVERYLARSTAIVIPIGSAEQHGPNGLIGTDAICAEVIARGLGEKLEAMVAPTLAVGMAQHHLRFPGTIALRPSTLLALIADVVESLALHGFDHMYFLNGHGGNTATVTAAFSELWAKRSFRDGGGALRLRIYNWWQSEAVRAVSSELFPGVEGSHATPSEVSLSYYAHPEAARTANPMDPAVAPTGAIRDADDFRYRFPDGRIGSDPSRASTAAGERIYAAALEGALADYQRFVSGD